MDDAFIVGLYFYGFASLCIIHNFGIRIAFIYVFERFIHDLLSVNLFKWLVHGILGPSIIDDLFGIVGFDITLVVTHQ